uniref:Uncharacterized protein n=1 Tax=Cyprinodon variegatus TaxID=28743 RepID=A0A3Q2DMB6_CYPVA
MLPCKFISFYDLENKMESKVIEVATLGRPFSLGMLYDCREDTVIPGLTLWNRDDLEKDKRETPKPNSCFEIVASESIEDKSSALDVEASLKASFLGGLVKVEGSAKYLNDQVTSKNQARVTLKYKASTKFEELSMNHLGRGNVKHPYVFENRIATHVVTGILYGAQAFFVFDQEKSETESHQDIRGNLKVLIEKIPCLSIEGKGSLHLEDKDTEKIKKFSCKFHGDFLLEKTPTTFQDAVEIYQNLPKLLGANGEKAVPIKVWMLPLTNLDSSAAKLVREISVGLVQEVQSVLEEFSELEIRCNDTMKNNTAQQFPQIYRKLQSFKSMCSEFRLGFQQTLAKKLPSIQGGGEEESELAEILKKKASSPFNSKTLNEWMDCKEREINILKSFTKMMKNTKIIPSPNTLDEELLTAEYAVCFVFTSLERGEPYLSALQNYLKSRNQTDDSHTNDALTDELNSFFTRSDSPHTGPLPALNSPHTSNHQPLRPFPPTAATPTNPRPIHTSSRAFLPPPPLALTPMQVRGQLRRLKQRKASGPDGLPPRLLRTCADELCQILSNMYNLSLIPGGGPHPVEDLLCGSGSQNATHQGSSPLQTSHPDLSPDEDHGAPRPRPSSPHPAAVRLPAQHRSR